MILKTYQDLNDFLWMEIEKLSYQQTKSLVEFYIQDFIAKIPRDFYKNEIPEEQIYFKQLYALVKNDIPQWNWEKIEQVIENLNQNSVEMGDDYPEDLGLFGSDLFDLITYYQDFLKPTTNFHWLAIDILMRYFGSLHNLLNIDFNDKEWASNPHVKKLFIKIKILSKGKT